MLDYWPVCCVYHAIVCHSRSFCCGHTCNTTAPTLFLQIELFSMSGTGCTFAAVVATNLYIK